MIGGGSITFLRRCTLLPSMHCCGYSNSQKQNSTTPTPSTSKNIRPWRDAASVILVAPSQSDTPNFLVMKRSKGSGFAPSTLCFPGGTIHPADADKDWIDVFMQSTGGDPSKATFMAPTAQKPIIYFKKPPFQTLPEDANELNLRYRSQLPPEVSLRICAIRETFEECGILLCRYNTPEEGRARIGRDNKILGLGYTTNPVLFEDPDELEHWQQKVRSHPGTFIKLCQKYLCRPDLNALVEWSNWLTPNSFPVNRFDTIFYMAILPTAVPYLMDEHEVASVRWIKAKDVLQGAAMGKARLIPPQIYELTRLQTTSIKRLNTLMKMRLQLGIERLCPCYIKAQDGMLSVFPGDDLYPLDYRIDNFEDIRFIPSTMDELRNSTNNHHRIQFRSEHDFDLLVNISSSNGQIYV